MKKFAVLVCLAASTVALAACESSTTHHSGANYANERTAGNMDAVRRAPAERVFKAAQTK